MEKEKDFVPSPDLQKELDENEELKSKVEADREQYRKYLENQFNAKLEAEKQKAIEEAKKSAVDELTAKEQADKEKNEFLGQVPEKNRKFIQDALDDGKTIDYVKENYKDIVSQPEPQPEEKTEEKPVLNLHSFLDGKLSDYESEKGNDNSLSDEDFMKQANSGKNKNLLDPSSPDWERALAIKNKEIK